MSASRSCGSCTVCCTYLRIGTLKKPGLTPCPKLSEPHSVDGYTGTGCGQYADRPKVCSGYQCSWLRGAGTYADRPDRCGVLIDTVLPIENCLQAKPIRAGAADTAEGNSAINHMSADTDKPVLVAAFPETKMVRVVGSGVE